MSQLHCYVPEEVARQAEQLAKQAGLSVSRYLAELIKREAANNAGWPEGYFDVFGSWQGEPLERAPQGEFEERLTLE